MFKTLGFVTFVVGVFALGHGCREAQAAELSMCGPIDRIEEELGKAGEVPVVLFRDVLSPGEDQSVVIKAIYASAEKDTWTMVVFSGGHGCTMRNGTGVEVFGIEGPGNDAQ